MSWWGNEWLPSRYQAQGETEEYDRRRRSEALRQARIENAPEVDDELRWLDDFERRHMERHEKPKGEQ